MMQQPNDSPSPFLPGTQIQYAWDSTSLGLIKTCPRLYQYVMIEGWQPRGENVHLRFGIEYHQALQDYDNSRVHGVKHDDAVHDVIRELLIRTADFNPDHKSKTRENLIRTVVWYLDQFKDDSAQTITMPDGRPAVEVSFRFELDWGPSSIDAQMSQMNRPAAEILQDVAEGSVEDLPATQPYLLCGHLDRVVEYNDETFVMDRKTSSIAPSEYFYDQFEPNNQMTLYTLASQVVFQTKVKGVIIDAAQIAVGFSRFGRGFTYRTPDQIQEWLDDLRFWLMQAEHFATQGFWPQNDTACDKFGGCKFRSICSKSPSVREKFLEGNFEKGERWNPLKAR